MTDSICYFEYWNMQHDFHTIEDTHKKVMNVRKVTYLVDLESFILFMLQLFTGHPIIPRHSPKALGQQRLGKDLFSIFEWPFQPFTILNVLCSSIISSKLMQTRPESFNIYSDSCAHYRGQMWFQQFSDCLNSFLTPVSENTYPPLWAWDHLSIFHLQFWIKGQPTPSGNWPQNLLFFVCVCVATCIWTHSSPSSLISWGKGRIH